jgi:hypothetical protein
LNGATASRTIAKHTKNEISSFVPWTVECLDESVEAALFALPADMRASFERIVHLLETYNDPHVHSR